MYKMKPEKTRLLYSEDSEKLSIVYISTFPPRVCGIATFTEDLTQAMDGMMSPIVKSKVVAMNTSDVVSYRYPRKVILKINQDNQEEYTETALKINQMDEVCMVSIQHEFGIFSGEYGSHLVSFLQALKKPAVITFHTVLPDPNEELRSTVQSLAESASSIIVMTNLSNKILCQQYSIPTEKINVIPHGIHSQPYTSSRQAKMLLGYSDRIVLSTSGLISRGKGLEYVIDALPQVVSRFPNFIYIIVGATHPAVLEREGESYRNFLIEKICNLGLYDHVKLYNRYFPLSELLNFLKATDIYVSTPLEAGQAVSGTLSYALGAGRPVISTAFAQATEMINEEVGILVDFRSPDSYADAILQLLRNDEHRLQMGKNAYFRTRNMIWPNVAIQYARVFSEYAPRLAQVSNQKSLPRTKLDHLIHLTDSFGIVQYAQLTKRDMSSGYTLDNNAAALAVAVLYYSKLNSPTQSPSTAREKKQLLKLINTYLSFIDNVAQPDGHFLNFVKADRTLDDVLNRQLNLEESNARALYALALTSKTASLPISIRKKAFNLMQNRMKSGVFFDSPRATAICTKALCALMNGKVPIDGIDLDKMLSSHCDRLVELYQAARDADWEWFESHLTYSNGVMPEALLLGYHTAGNTKYLTVGKTTLDFLIKESFVNGTYMPLGKDGWHNQGEKYYHFDQQPEEVQSIVSALSTGYVVTSDPKYSRLMRQAFAWFLGDNSLGQIVYDRTTGGCYDGIGKKEINLNQGAGSTNTYLMARFSLI